MKKILTLAYLLAFCYSFSVAQNASKVYDFDLKLEIPLYVFGVGTYLAGQSSFKEMTPYTQAEVDALNLSAVSPFDMIATKRWSPAIGSATDKLLYASYLAPFTLFLGKEGRQNWGAIAIMYTEAFALNLGTVTFMKTSLRRGRPLLYNPDVPNEEKLYTDARLSFYSGHSSATATFSVLTAVMFQDLYPDSKLKGWVWAGAIALPLATATGRVLAGRHFPTDVITGLGVGALTGWMIPFIHRTQKGKNMKIFPMTGGALGAGMDLRF